MKIISDRALFWPLFFCSLQIDSILTILLSLYLFIVHFIDYLFSHGNGTIYLLVESECSSVNVGHLTKRAAFSTGLGQQQ